MSQYSVLLVDDEEDVIKVIMKKLEWESMGFTITGYARNGIEALEMAEANPIDIVMTDIKMPYMDGLTLAKRLKESYPNIKVIIFSGFDEFEYAKEAIKIEAEEYILKPINSVELKEAFLRIKSNLDKEMDEKRNIEKLRTYYEQSLPLLQDNFLVSLIEGNIQEHQIERYLANYNITLKGPFYTVSVLHVSGEQMSESEHMDPMLMVLAVKQLAEEHLSDRWNSKIVLYLRDIVVITSLQGKESIPIFTDTLDKICKLAKRICSAQVTAGVGYICNSLEQLPLSYQGANNAVSYRVFYGSSRAINIAEVDPQRSTSLVWEDTDIEQILKNIKFGQVEVLNKSIEEFAIHLRQSQISLEKYRVILLHLVTEMLRFVDSNQINPEGIFSAGAGTYNEVLQMDSIHDLEQWLKGVCQQMQSQLRSTKTDLTKSFVDKAVDYVKENYSNKDLSIETICSHLSVSAAYFSTVFKKETGKTFINYLTDYRMEQAVELLIGKEEKTYIIAEKVGYADPNYFSYVFKRKYGVSPSKYKASLME